MNATTIQQVDPLGSLASDGLKLAAILGGVVLFPAVLLIAAFGGLPDAGRSTASEAALAEVPPDHLAVMTKVGAETGIPWQVLAAIARVESDFGRNMATSSAGAIGYGQFLPEMWAAYGGGGDPYDFHAAIPAMARYLLDHGAPADLRNALYAYNHSWDYVDTVLAHAAAYGYVDPSSTPARAVALARSRMGAPYVWGAVGPETFDCSGLVLWTYSQLGLQPPRTAQQQFEWATPIETSALQPGDLTYYEATYPSSDRITHVGIYAGGGVVVMATNAGETVREVRLDDRYWSSHFVGAGRPPYANGGRP